MSEFEVAVLNMKSLKRLTIILALVLLAGYLSVASAQTTGSDVCIEPFSATFADFGFTSKEDLSSRAREFESKLDETPESRGIVFVFGGKKERLNEIRDMIEIVKDVFPGRAFGYNEKLFIQDGGFREHTSIVFIFAPLRCSAWQVPASDYRADQIDFAEFPSESLVRSSSNEFYRDIVDGPEVECPAAGRAVRACVEGTVTEVYVIVDDKGHVAYSKCISGHPLNRAKAETGIRTWKFRPLLVDGKPVSRSGFITVEFTGGPDIVDY